MSSNVNVGFMDGRMGSRILKPPGGGYSELFFTNEDATTLTPKKTPPARIESSIESILRNDNNNAAFETPKRKTPVKTAEIAKILHEENDAKSTKHQQQIVEETTTMTIERKVEELKINETKQENGGGNKIEQTEDVPLKAVIEVKTPEIGADSPGRRGRVPPGGFSTALW